MDTLEFEIEAAKSRFESERARKDTVRSSIAIPIAALSFAAFGFGTVVRSLIFHDGTDVAAFLSALALAGVAAALFLFLSAISVFRRIDYIDAAPPPEALDTNTQFLSLRDELVRQGIPAAEADRIATDSVWKFVKETYDTAAEKQFLTNSRNLSAQRDMLSYLLWGVGCLLAALAVVGLAQLLNR